jgi:imidazolonepropionase
MGILIRDASQILTMTRGVGIAKGSSIMIANGVIEKIGSMKSSPRHKIIDARGCVVCPGFVDAHTHLVFGGSREDEFAMRIKGVKYEAIARAGGGIASTVKNTTRASEDELCESAERRIKNIIKHGTTTVEIKSGYGLIPDVEYKMLRTIKRLQKRVPIDVLPTFLVHTVPRKMKRADYVRLVRREMIPYVAKKKLAAFCDVFCDNIAFTRKESDKILSTARAYGLKLKIHVDEFANIGGSKLAARLRCVSADHLLVSTKSDIVAMKKAEVIPTLLPGTSVFLRLSKKPNIKAFRDTRSAVAIASDFNPGSCMIYSMLKIIALACLAYGMYVEEALIAATRNAAKALGLFDRIGSIEEGKQGDLVVLNVDNYKKIPYGFGEDMVKYTIKKGRIIYGKNN